MIYYIDIKESIEMKNGFSLNYYYIQNERFGSLDKIIENYINPINSLMKEIFKNKKFKNESEETLKKALKEEKEQDSKHMPFLFCSFDYTGQYIALCYIIKDLEVSKEFIKVTSKGLVFHDFIFPSINNLFSYFKNSFKSVEYQTYLKRAKSPFYDLDCNLIEIEEDNDKNLKNLPLISSKDQEEEEPEVIFCGSSKKKISNKIFFNFYLKYYKGVNFGGGNNIERVKY